MEAVGVGLAVAALFTECIECFELFKTGADFERTYELLLVKLEIEQERLLVWGDLVGIGDRQKEKAGLELVHGKESIVHRGLENINKILHDADTLKTRYGVYKADIDGRTRDLGGISTSALKRFRLRFGKHTVPGVIKKTQWAVSDATKFERLVKDVRELIDGLAAIVPAETQAQRIEDDIANLVDDLDSLELLSEAWEEDYPSLYKAAGHAIDASEHGTYAAKLSTRADTLPSDAISSANVLKTQQHGSTLFQSSKMIGAQWDNRVKVFFVLTQPCLRLNTDDICDQTGLGEQILSESTYKFFTDGPGNFGSRPGLIMRSRIDYASFTPYSSNQITELKFRLRDMEARSVLSDSETETPSTTIHTLKAYIYCAPCACQIDMAIDTVLWQDDDWWIGIDKNIRVDYRLTSSCCPDDSNRVNAAISLLQDVKKHPDDETFECIDSNYLDTLLYEF